MFYKEFDRLKKEAQQNNQERIELMQHMYNFFQREQQSQTTDEVEKLKAEVLRKSMEITTIRSQYEKDLQRLSSEVKILRHKIGSERTRRHTMKQENKQLIKDKSTLKDVVEQLNKVITAQKEVIERLEKIKNQTSSGYSYIGSVNP